MPPPELSPTTKRPLLFAACDHRLALGRVFGVLPEELLRHVNILGRTGSGKSVLLESLLREQLRAGHGVGLLDPHGDLAERVLELVPRSRTNEVVYIDAADAEHPVGLNPLDLRGDRTRLVSTVLAVFRKAFSESWGPRLEHVYRNALFALTETRDATLLGVLRLLTDDAYRARVLAQVTDPVVRYFWTHEFEKYPPTFRAEVCSPVQNKVAAALSSPLLRGMLGQIRATVSLREVMDEGRIFIGNLAKGKLGEDGTSLLGALLLGHFQHAAYERADVPASARRPFTLYVDEFPSFATSSFASALVEVRKYGLGLVLAHQHLAQLDEGLCRAVLGNVGSLVVFRVGPEDAEVLAPIFAPALTAEDLVNLGRHQIALRLAVDGVTSAPFTAVTLPPTPEAELANHGAVIRRVSRERYGTPRAVVERQVEEQMR